MTSDTHACMHTHYTIQLLHQLLEFSYNHCNHYHNVLCTWSKQLHHCRDKKQQQNKQYSSNTRSSLVGPEQDPMNRHQSHAMLYPLP